ncbi:hypothetical protein BJ741DRAFT_595180 [Chytriomyces cf. hyalinus JEL632]|nr:hypothetical protein BJ741DRAFT_595180 [Chytriomyces cf. hyalinus JEL632]
MSCFQLSASSICGQEFANVWLSPTQGHANEPDFNSNLEKMVQTNTMHKAFKCRGSPSALGAMQYQMSYLCSSAALKAASVCGKQQPVKIGLCQRQCSLAAESANSVLSKERCDDSLVSQFTATITSKCDQFSKSVCWVGVPSEVISCGFLDGRLCQPSDSHLAPSTPVDSDPTSLLAPVDTNAKPGLRLASVGNTANQPMAASVENSEMQPLLQSQPEIEPAQPPPQPILQIEIKTSESAQIVETRKQTLTEKPQPPLASVGIISNAASVDSSPKKSPSTATATLTRTDTSTRSDSAQREQAAATPVSTTKESPMDPSQIVTDTKTNPVAVNLVVITAIFAVLLFLAICAGCYCRRHRRNRRARNNEGFHKDDVPSAAGVIPYAKSPVSGSPTSPLFQSKDKESKESLPLSEPRHLFSNHQFRQTRGKDVISTTTTTTTTSSSTNDSTISRYLDMPDIKEQTTSTVEIRGKEFMHVKFSADTKKRDAPPKFEKKKLRKVPEKPAEIPKRSASRNQIVAIELDEPLLLPIHVPVSETSPPVSPTPLPPAHLVRSILKKASAQKNSARDG